MRWYVASGNAHKVRELAEILGPTGAEVESVKALGTSMEVDEYGSTFAANAAIKARAWVDHAGVVALADDSGLEVDALGGAPGVRSARYAGPSASDAENNARLIAALAGVPDGARAARYRCVVALGFPPGCELPELEWRTVSDPEEIGGDDAVVWGGVAIVTASGTLDGGIRDRACGGGGFGYDPHFEMSDGRSLAEWTPSEKNAVSHRGEAARRLLHRISGFGGVGGRSAGEPREG